MAEGLAIAASVIAVIQLTDRIANAVNFYVETLRDDLPSDLRVILSETAALKTVFEKLHSEVDETVAKTLAGPVNDCKKALQALKDLLPTKSTQTQGCSPKVGKMRAALFSIKWSFKETKVNKLLDNISRHKATIQLVLTKGSLTQDQLRDVFNWLEHTNPSPLHNQACEQFTPGTAEWVCRMPEWTDWIEARFRCLWIHGIPGAGKTVLISHLIKQLKCHRHNPSSTKVALVYYYCYYGRNQDEAAPFLRWLLNQLCRQSNVVPKSLYKLYKAGTEATVAEILLVVLEMIVHFDKIYVVIDALDESSPRGKLLDVIHKLATNKNCAKIQTLVSSREYPEIEKVLNTFATPVSMDNEFVRQDIRLCVHSLLRSKNAFRHWPITLFDEVEEALSTGAQGMFRWAVCQVDVLRRLKGDRTVIEKSLKDLPKTLDDIYDRIFLLIDEEERLYALHALLWIVNTASRHSSHNSGRIISTQVLPIAAVKSTSRFNTNYRDRFYDFEILADLLGCLIRETTDSKVVLAHYTVKEYLYSSNISTVLTNITSIPPSSLRNVVVEAMFDEVLAMENFEVCMDAPKILMQLEGFCVMKLLEYLKEGMIDTHNDDYVSLSLDLLDPSKSHYISLLKITGLVNASKGFGNAGFLRMEMWAVHSNGSPLAIRAFHLSNIDLLTGPAEARLSLLEKLSTQPLYHEALHESLSLQFCSNSKVDGSKQSYFQGTLAEWNPGLALSLYESANNSNFLPSNYGSDLMLLCAAHKGRQICCRSVNEPCELKRLLETGISPDFAKHSVTPLQIATLCCDFEAVKLLLEAGADPNRSGIGQVDEGSSIDLRDPDGCIQSHSRVSFNFFCRYYQEIELHNFGFYFKKGDFRSTEDENDRAEIEKLLLQFGAKEIGNIPTLEAGSGKKSPFGGTNSRCFFCKESAPE
ncbi:hypothetical protein B0J11DRAFT_564044 [Dendryphion nanum]|uniref:NACHT domain-containing protein n=1 Tax=Dendryphion nanum TaxID=256645 RepID=A0A9P9EJZ1_9PLEO|nr:hypothetical protein B0J11DRAFT_564044 [Dendryphion nanum]